MFLPAALMAEDVWDGDGYIRNIKNLSPEGFKQFMFNNHRCIELSSLAGYGEDKLYYFHEWTWAGAARRFLIELAKVWPRNARVF